MTYEVVVFIPGIDEGLVCHGDTGDCVLFANDGGVKFSVCSMGDNIGHLSTTLGRLCFDLSCLLGGNLGGVNGMRADAVTL